MKSALNACSLCVGPCTRTIISIAAGLTVFFWTAAGLTAVVHRYVFVPSSGLDENNIKGAFYPGAPLAPLPYCKAALTQSLLLKALYK